MAWSWSHTQEAYAAVEAKVKTQDRGWLQVVWAEWQATNPHRFELPADDPRREDEDYESGFSQERYKEAFEKAQTLPDDVMAEEIWEKMSAAAVCDNGGFDAWSCPDGCACHTIGFDDPEPGSRAAQYLEAQSH